MNPMLPLIFDIEEMPSLSNPLVQAYIDPDIEITEAHIKCIQEAIQMANRKIYGEKK